MRASIVKTEELIGFFVPLIFIALMLLESRRNARPFEAVKNWRRIGILFFVMVVVVGSIVPLLLPVAWLRQHSVVDLSGWSLFFSIPAGILTATFFGYWLHRSFHRFTVLWLGTHQLHHSAQRVDVAGAYFAHPNEIMLKVGLSTLVGAGLLGLMPIATASMGLFVAAASMFQHTNIATPRWLGFFVQRPESHCLHHEFSVHARNYSDLPLWDMVFGTFHNPATFTGKVGFQLPSAPSIADLLLMRDVNK